MTVYGVHTYHSLLGISPDLQLSCRSYILPRVPSSLLASAKEASYKACSHNADQSNATHHQRSVGTNDIPGTDKDWLIAHVRLKCVKLAFLFFSKRERVRVHTLEDTPKVGAETGTYGWDVHPMVLSRTIEKCHHQRRREG